MSRRKQYTVISRSPEGETRTVLGRWLKSKREAVLVARVWADHVHRPGAVVVLDDTGATVHNIATCGGEP